MGRSPCCDKAAVKRGPWSPEEDEALRSYVERHGSGGNWIALPKKAGLKRCGKSCRLRWLNYLRPDIKHGGFTEEEDNIICSLYNKLGSRWSLIASHLKGRTDNDVKNYWNTKLKKRVMAAQSPGPIGEMNGLATAATGTASTSAELTGLFVDSPVPPPPLLPLVIPTIKTETYTCDDFMAPMSTLASITQDPFAMSGDLDTCLHQYIVSPHPTEDGSTASASSSVTTNWSASGPIGQTCTGTGLFQDCCWGSDVTTDQLLTGYYLSLDPNVSSLGSS